MPRGERRLADLLFEDVGMLRHSSAGELADRADLSKARRMAVPTPSIFGY